MSVKIWESNGSLLINDGINDVMSIDLSSFTYSTNLDSVDVTLIDLSSNFRLRTLSSELFNLNGTPIGTYTEVIDFLDSLVPIPEPVTTIYSEDGSITGNRTVTGDVNDITFDNFNSFNINSVLYVKKEGWTIDFLDALITSFTAPHDMSIDSITNIKNSPTITILLNAVAYTFGDAIVTGDRITVSASIPSVVTLNTTRV